MTNIQALACTITLAFTLTFIHKGFSDNTYIEGTVVSALTGSPLDSVRVASVFYNTVTISDSNGHFLIKKTQNTSFNPEARTVDSFDVYSVHFASTNKHLISRGTQNRPSTVSLCDISGRIVHKSQVTSTIASFPDHSLPCGVYVLNVDGSKASRIIVTDNHSHGYIGQKRHEVVNLTHPTNKVNDTIVFSKKNLTLFSASIEEIQKNETVHLFEKRWVAFDVHNHTVLTDGSYIQDTVLAHSFGEGGLDVFVNSEHGGSFYTDTANARHGYSIPRWYSLIYYSWPKLLGQRNRYPGKIILQGLEWNCPGHEHASVGIIDDIVQPGAIAQFEYLFDYNDNDIGMPWLTKQNNYQHTNALAGLKWLQDNFPSTSYCFVNHPSREAIGPYDVEHFRDFHNIAPDVFLGLEGMPGHHKCHTRGSYCRGAEPRHRTWGGADYIIARIGGLWDALLGEGRHLWIIVDSDFHATGSDFWPGQYAKTHVAVTDTGARAWLNGMKSGDMFIAHGDLISDLEFSIDDGISRTAMGSDLHTDTTSLFVTIRFKSPVVNNNDQRVRVDHIDLIAGSITGKVDPMDTDSYKSPNNPTTSVIRRFFTSDWKTENGWTVINTTVSCTQPTYFRLRGTNLADGTPNETDLDGNPLMDEDGMNTEAKAWNDLWFYSNPIFVYQR